MMQVMSFPGDPVSPLLRRDLSPPVVDESVQKTSQLFQKTVINPPSTSSEEVLAPKELNLIVRMNQLAADLFRFFSQLSERDRDRVEKVKKEVREAVAHIVDTTHEKGKSGLYIALGSIGMLFATFIPYVNTHTTTSEIIKSLSTQFPQIFGPVTANLDASLAQWNSIKELLFQEYMNISQKDQTNNNSKEEIKNLLREFLNILKSATQGG